MKRIAVCLLALVTLSAVAVLQPASPIKKTTIKLATLVPDGSVWDKSFRKMGSEWKRDTDGRVELRMYPGGAAGDEPDILRKLRIGQLNAAALTTEGLANIDPAFRIFEIPMFFESAAELQFVLDALAPELAGRLEAKGFVLLNWGHAGWVHLFSTQPVRSPADLKKLKQFVWAGDERGARFWRENGFQPVPLAATDIPMGLQTGMIEAVPAPPLSVLGFQWFRSTPYMMKLGALPFLGGTVVSKKTWDKISKEDRAAMLAACSRSEAYLAAEIPVQERAAIAEMQKRGLKLVEPTDGGAVWRSIADRYADSLREKSIPADLFQRVEKLQAEFRQQNPDAGNQAGTPAGGGGQ